MAYFDLVSSLTTTAATVASLPVPAVEGIAISKGIRPPTFKIPRIFSMPLRGLATRAAKPFAVSMLEPPPKATIA